MAYNWILFKSTLTTPAVAGNAVCNHTTIFPGPGDSAYMGVFPAYGWNSNVLGNDYSSPTSSYFLGANRVNASGGRFGIQLPNGPGKYRIRMAMGFSSAAYTPMWRIRDGSQTGDILLDKSTSNGTVPAGQAMDVNGVIHTSYTNWESNNTYFEFTSNTGTIYITREGGVMFPINAIGIEMQLALRDITAPGAHIAESQPVGTVIGTLSGQIDGIGLSLTDSANGTITLSGNNLVTNTVFTYSTSTPTLNVSVTETKAGYDGSPKTSIITIPIRRVYTPPTYSPKAVYPGESWNGTEGSGYSTTPSDPTLTTAKAMVGLTDVPLQRFNSDFYIKVQAFAKGGIESVKCYCEGNVITEESPRRWKYVDENGKVQKFFGYIFKISYADFESAGAFNLYFEAIASDMTIQNTVIGPYMFHVASTVYDATVTVDGTQSTNTGLLRFNTVVEAHNYLVAQGKQHGLIEIANNSVDYIFNTGTTRSDVRGWYHIRSKDGVGVVNFREPTRSSSSWYVPSGTHFGRNIHIDVGTFPQIYNASGVYWIWYDGGRFWNSLGRNAILDGTDLPQPWRNSGHEENQRQFFTEYELFDLVQGPKYNHLVRNTFIDKISGDVLTNTKQMAGVHVNENDSTTLRNGWPAMTVRYTGSQSVCTIQKVGGNGVRGSGDTTKSSGAVTATTATSLFTGTQNWTTGTPVTFTGTTLPTGITAGTIYYTINQSSTTFKVATSSSNASSGTAVTITTTGSDVRVHPWVTAGLVFRYATDVAFIIPFTANSSSDSGWWVSDIAAIINGKADFTAVVQTNDKYASPWITATGASGLGAFAAVDCKTSAFQLIVAGDVHADGIQMQNLTGFLTYNLIYTNVKFTKVNGSQVIFLSNSAPMNGLAFINWIASSSIPGPAPTSQVGGGPKRHLLMYNLTYHEQYMQFRTEEIDDYFDMKQCVMGETRDSALYSYGPGATADRNIHASSDFLPFETNGIVASWTDTLTDPVNGDFSPIRTGPAVTNADIPVIPFDYNWEVRNTISALGAIENYTYKVLPKGVPIELTRTQFDALVQQTDFDSVGVTANSAVVTYNQKQVDITYDIKLNP